MSSSRHRTWSRLLTALAALALLAAPPVWERGGARGFRSLQPIPTPESLPEDATRPARFDPVSRQVVLRGIDAIVEAWNTGRLAPVLDANFVDRRRLVDTLREVVPRDALIRVRSVRSISTIDQYFRGDEERVTTISAVVETQIEFDDPNTGFQRLAGENEFVLRVTEPIRS